MSSLDITLLALLIWGTYRGYSAGFLMSLFSFLAIIVAVLVTFTCTGFILYTFVDRFGNGNHIVPYIIFALVFIAVIMIVTWVGRLVKNAANKNLSGTVDQVLGGVLGALKTAFTLSVIIWVIDAMRIYHIENHTQQARLYQWVAQLAPSAAQALSDHVPFLKDIFNR